MNVGRPNQELRKKMTIKIDEETYNKIWYLSRVEGVCISEYVRKLIKKSI